MSVVSRCALQYILTLIVIFIFSFLPACRRSAPSVSGLSDIQINIDQANNCSIIAPCALYDVMLKMVDIPLPLHIVSLDRMSEISQDGTRIYAAFQVIDDYARVLLFYLHEMERYGWHATTNFTSQNMLHSMVLFEKPDGYSAVVIILVENPDVQKVTIKIYRTAPGV